MKDKKRRAKLQEIVGYHTEALRLTGGISANQRRFIEVVAKYGKELDRMVGWREKEAKRKKPQRKSREHLYRT
ncbi:MAG: hypothetical protein ABS999_03220 [Pseudomonas atacamensis]|uniref:hypothetical protein n=1 Tax=Pseudomonas atacamensis TaxID=2565368 RepID=UPI003315B770